MTALHPLLQAKNTLPTTIPIKLIPTPCGIPNGGSILVSAAEFSGSQTTEENTIQNTKYMMKHTMADAALERSEGCS